MKLGDVFKGAKQKGFGGAVKYLASKGVAPSPKKKRRKLFGMF